jgi:hypothetical protein
MDCRTAKPILSKPLPPYRHRLDRPQIRSLSGKSQAYTPVAVRYLYILVRVGTQNVIHDSEYEACQHTGLMVYPRAGHTILHLYSLPTINENVAS